MFDFTVIRRFENYQYIEGCPIFITGGNLLKDRETNNIFVQTRFKSISPKCISAVIFDIVCFDIENETLEGVTRYQLLDLNIKNGETFGDKELICCPNKFTRKCNVVVKSVIFSDDTRWEFSENDKIIVFGLQSRVPDKKLLPVLIDDFKSLNYPADKVIYIPKTYEYHWICTCGAINHYNRECSVCGMNKSKLFELFDDRHIKAREEEYNSKLELMEKERERRRELDKQRKAEEQRYQHEIELKHQQLIDRENEERKRENKKTLYIILAVIAVIIILAFFSKASTGAMDTNKDRYNSQDTETEYYDDYYDYGSYDSYDYDYDSYDNTSIYSIGGTEYSPDAVYIDLSGQDLTNDDIQNLCNFTNLETLVLSNNRISDISCLAGLTSLKALDLYNNQIEDISALSNMTHLQDLNLTQNRILSISPLIDLEEMKTLWLSYNQIVNVYALKNMDDLEEVVLDNNKLVSISGLKDKTHLKKLYLNDNKSIESFAPLTGCSSLELLNVINTNCSTDDIKMLENALPDCNIFYVEPKW